MPTRNPRVTFAVTDEELASIDDFMNDNRIRNQSKAVRDLVNRGLSEYKKIQDRKSGTCKHLSADSIAIAEDYESLAPQGQRVVQQVVDAAVVLFGEPPISLVPPPSASDPNKPDLLACLLEERGKIYSTG